MTRIKKIIGKKATGHIEIVLSFIIFIGFVIFLFSVFPVYRIKKSEIGLDSAERGIMNFTSAKVNYFALFLDRGAECFSHPIKELSSKVIAMDFEGKRITAKSKNDNLYIKDTDYSHLGHGKFYGIYYSGEFSEEGYDAIPGDLATECKNLTDQGIDYGVGLVREDYAVSYNKTVKLIDQYNNRYEEVRGNFSIPAGENFEFSITDLKGNIILNASRKKPERTTVLSRNTPIQMVYKNGTYVFGMLNVRTW